MYSSADLFNQNNNQKTFNSIYQCKLISTGIENLTKIAMIFTPKFWSLFVPSLSKSPEYLKFPLQSPFFPPQTPEIQRKLWNSSRPHPAFPTPTTLSQKTLGWGCTDFPPKKRENSHSRGGMLAALASRRPGHSSLGALGMSMTRVARRPSGVRIPIFSLLYTIDPVSEAGEYSGVERKLHVAFAN